MYPDLKGKVAIVTGGGRDIGRQIALKLAANGVSVCLSYFGSEEGVAETLSLSRRAVRLSILVRRQGATAAVWARLLTRCIVLK